MRKQKNPIIYGVFGDTPRSDADNIESLWFNENLAKDRLKWLEENDEYNSYHMEVLYMKDQYKEKPQPATKNMPMPEFYRENKIKNEIKESMEVEDLEPEIER